MVYLNMEELIYHNNNVHFGPFSVYNMKNLKRAETFCILSRRTPFLFMAFYFLFFKIYKIISFNPIQVGGGAPPTGFFPSCAETACSRLMKLSDF